LSDGLPLFDGW